MPLNKDFLLLNREGFVLGPLLFFLFINDLPDSIKHYVKIYTDDSKIIDSELKIISEDDIQALQEDIDNTVTWSNKLLMSLNL